MKIITQSGFASAGPSVNSNSVAKYSQLSTRYDAETGAIWCWMHPEPRPCMNTRLIDELTQLQQQLTSTYQSQQHDKFWPLNTIVLASKTPGIYNLGGDLELMKGYIENRDEIKLREYAYKATDLVYNNINNLDLPITMISLVQGQTLGAGFEAALSCDVIIAEQQAQLGFPEIIFNMFPGMGAYNLLARRIGPALAERMILSGKTYPAEELRDMGVIDVLVGENEGVEATEAYMKSLGQTRNTMQSMRRIRQLVHPITRQELIDIVDIWIEASMNLGSKELAKMERLLFLQKSLKTSQFANNDTSFIKRRGDWRVIRNIDFPVINHLGECINEDRRKISERRKQGELTYS